MTKNKMVQLGIEDIKKGGKGWKEILKVRFLGKKKSLEKFHPLTHIKVRQC
jgi:hypothetical protein